MGVMRVGLAVGHLDEAAVAFVVDAERLGIDSVWVPEAWGYDAFTPLAFLAARTSRLRLATGVAQVGARTPAMLAMSAMSMQQLSGGRFLLGLGVSGPQVMEGWHGVRFTAPVRTTRETVQIVRAVSGGERVHHEGRVFSLPLPDSEGRALRSAASPVTVPVYLAALGPANLELTGEVADGWLGNAFVPESAGVFLGPLAAGAARSGRTLADLDLVIPVALEITDDAEGAARRHAAGYAFTIGAMGSARTNFYRSAWERQGWGDDVAAVAELWRAGHREEAAARVPVELGARTNLLGPPAAIAERLVAYRDAGVTTLQVKLATTDRTALDALAQLLDLVAELDAGPETRPGRAEGWPERSG